MKIHPSGSRHTFLSATARLPGAGMPNPDEEVGHKAPSVGGGCFAPQCTFNVFNGLHTLAPHAPQLLRKMLRK